LHGALVNYGKWNKSHANLHYVIQVDKASIRNFNDVPDRIEKGIKAWEEKGCKMVGFFATMCEYDYVGIAEAPNDGMAVNQKKELC
jgi:uncharacterized protein with GYD domain